ncbi:MAG: HAD-IA family hydrolase [Myxococcales bacterium]
MLPLAPSHVIFDLDGTLLDTEPLYTQAAQAVVGRFGKTYDWSIKRHTIGGDPHSGARFVVDTLKLPISPQQYLEEREGMMRELCKTARPKPGAQGLVENLSRRGIPLAIGTSSGRELCEIKLAPHAFMGHFRSVVCSDDPGIRGGKPAPDIFLKAAAELGAEPARCLVFEDTLMGVRAAVAAGMQVIVVPDANLSDVDFSAATHVLTSLEGLELAALGL